MSAEVVPAGLDCWCFEEGALEVDLGLEVDFGFFVDGSVEELGAERFAMTVTVFASLNK